MKIDYTRLYLSATLASLGGFLSWITISIVDYDVSTDDALRQKTMLFGLIIGGFIGGLTGTIDGLFLDYSKDRALNGLKMGAAIGSVGGVAGLLIAEELFQSLENEVWSRAFGWGCFGILLGVSKGIINKSQEIGTFCCIGGFLGGMIGGGAYETLSSYFLGGSEDRALAFSLSSATGLLLLGVSLGSFMALLEDVLRKGWITYLDGFLEGQTRTLDSTKGEFTMGSLDSNDIYFHEDPSVKNFHAKLLYNNIDKTMQVVKMNGDFIVFNEDAIEIKYDSSAENGGGLSFSVVSGDILKLGDTRIQLGFEEAKIWTI